MKHKDTFPTIGILGGGQLGRMSALVAIRMGVHVKTLSPSPAGPVAPLGEALVADWNDPDMMADFVKGCDVVTVESEWGPAEVAENLDNDIPVWPSSHTLQAIRHKGRQKKVLEEAGIPLPRHAICASFDEATTAFRLFDNKVVAKRFEGSYDGYGNATVTSEAELEQAWKALAAEDGLLIESFVPFVRELAVLVARSPSGESVVYPVVDTEQKDHRCHAVTVPAGISAETDAKAQELALAAADAVKSVGILGVEFFELPDGSLLLNELAPRPHNTGHYTIEACHTSQFENHVRAILDWPLGDPSLRVPAAVMINVLGHREGPVCTQGLQEALSIAGASVHIYGKKEAKPKRKMGHVTVTAENTTDARLKAEQAALAIQL
ncbi:MAG: 5-(carboxyamino)imidazole ribonucleotide synthase [Rhodothermales bacterium]|nr:5-(carboxyamino)imidazole ribonucleotide synthase [Rhodothermales bacterium]MDG2017097.1 5-(carboxyamino)imidazole ribonucleotide synthase [Rhodothermales bacterium]